MTVFCTNSYDENLSENGDENGSDFSYDDTAEASEYDVDLNRGKTEDEVRAAIKNLKNGTITRS